jgi:hypothetical protein
VQRHEGDHVNGTDPWMDALMPAEIDRRHGLFDQREHGRHQGVGPARERQHGPIV